MATRRVFFSNGSAGSFTLPVDFDASQPVIIACVGGGGGGSRRAASGGGGGGGGGGAVAVGSFSGLVPGQPIWYNAGVGGAGTSVTNSAGTAGGASWANINSNSSPLTNAQGVLAAAGTGATTAAGGSGGTTASSLGNVGTAAGGAGSTVRTSNGSGGSGGGAAGKWNGTTTFATGGNGGTGFLVAGDGGGGGGGGVSSAGTNATSINGATGGQRYDLGVGGTAGAAQAGGTSYYGGGGGGGAGYNTNNVGIWSGGQGGYCFLSAGSGTLAYGLGGGGGGGGGGTNNSGTTGGLGGTGGNFGGGGGGGGSGVTATGNGGPGGKGCVMIQYTAKSAMLPSTNLSLSAIQTYFGGANPASLDEYFRGSSLVSSYASNTSGTLIPSSGTIAFSNFAGAPFKNYRVMTIGWYYVPPSKFITQVSEYGYGGTGGSGAISDTSFTLSGGSGVAINGIYWDETYQYMNLYVTYTTAVTNTGWSQMILSSGLVFQRASAAFIDNGGSPGSAVWQWSQTSYPFLNQTPIYGMQDTVYFV